MTDKQSPTVRVSRITFEKLLARKRRLERWLDTASLAQRESVYLPNPPHDRFGISLDTIILRLLHAVEAQERRAKQSRNRRACPCKE